MTDSVLAAAAALFKPPAPPATATALDVFNVPSVGRALGRGYARTALDNECAAVMAAPNGQRNHTLNRAAFNLGQLVAGGALDENVVIDELAAAASLAGLDTDPGCGPVGVSATIRSGLSAATMAPRSVPTPSPTPTPTTTNPEPDDDEPSYLDVLRAALVDTTGLDAIPEPTPVIDGVLYRDSTAWLIGPPGNGKSFIALDIAGCVATGERWHGYDVATGPVLYLVAEGLWGIRSRVRAWESSNGHAMSDVAFLPIAVQAAQPGPWTAFCDLASEIRPAVIVIDTQARVTVGAEENSAKDMGEFVHAVESLRKSTGACVLVVHHTGKSGTMRGSTALEGAATTIIHTEKDDDLITIECRKQKDAAEFAEFELRLAPHGDSAVLVPALAEAKTWRMTPFLAKVLRRWHEIFEGDEVSITALADAGVFQKSTFHKHRKDLVRNGYLASVGTTHARRYQLVRVPEESTNGPRR